MATGATRIGLMPLVRLRPLAASAVFLCVSLAMAQEPRLARGSALPRLDAVSLSGEARTLPQDAAGRKALFVIGFSKAAAKVTRGWLEACHGAEAVACYDVRMVEEVPHAFRG